MHQQKNIDQASEQVMSQKAVEKYVINDTFYLLIFINIYMLITRLRSLEDNYKNLMTAQERWPVPHSDSKQLYKNFYQIMQKVSHNIVCACCGIIGHNIDEFTAVSAQNEVFTLLAVNPKDVPFSFQCGITALDQQHIMIDPLAITDQGTISICQRCHSCLSDGSLPAEALANFRWIGPVPKELKDLTCVEEALIARSHLFGRIFRLEERKNREPAYSSLKGHIVLVPQNTMRLLNILPVSPDSLADIAHVVWVGKSEPDITKMAPQFTVRKQKVLDSLKWLQKHHEDYQNVAIDTTELDRWPSVFITEALLHSIAHVRSGITEDALKDGFATEDIDIKDFKGNIPNTVSGILDVNNISQSPHLKILQELQSLHQDLTINVVPGNKVLEHYQDSTYFTSAFPTLFLWGTGKHKDHRREKSELPLKA